jgi:hypothetical protein
MYVQCTVSMYGMYVHFLYDVYIILHRPVQQTNGHDALFERTVRSLKNRDRRNTALSLITGY